MCYMFVCIGIELNAGSNTAKTVCALYVNCIQLLYSVSVPISLLYLGVWYKCCTFTVHTLFWNKVSYVIKERKFSLKFL